MNSASNRTQPEFDQLFGQYVEQVRVQHRLPNSLAGRLLKSIAPACDHPKGYPQAVVSQPPGSV